MEQMSPDLLPLTSDSCITMCNMSFQDEPRDLSLKRRLRQVPPPLDLSKRNLELDQLTELPSPKSPLTQKNLPLRKRAYSLSSQSENAGCATPQSVIRSISEISGCDARYPASASRLNPSSASSISSFRFSGLPTPQTPHPHSAIPVITSRFNFNSDTNNNSNNSVPRPCHQHMGMTTTHTPLNLSTSSVGAPMLPSSLLSPAPSHPSSSSLNSSREELEPEGSTTAVDYRMASPRLSPAQPVVMVSVAPSVLGPASSPHVALLENTHPPPSPSHHWPTTVWSIFVSGVHVHFLLPSGQVMAARLSEDLGTLERAHHDRYAPHGLRLLKALKSQGPHNAPCQMHFRPVRVQQEEIMVVAPPDHPFYVHGKGWCSFTVDEAVQRYNVPCQQLQEGDLCLPPYHPETTQTTISVVTPDITDAMKRFDFNDTGMDSMSMGGGSCSAPPSATLTPYSPHQQQQHRSVFLSPPASPSKKAASKMPSSAFPSPADVCGTVAVVPKSRRPMNGFMLFAKRNRLNLIQQYPGKDNRAISVLLGEMWRFLPQYEQERFRAEARVLAEQMKRVDPDCWKRRRSHSTS